MTRQPEAWEAYVAAWEERTRTGSRDPALLLRRLEALPGDPDDGRRNAALLTLWNDDVPPSKVNGWMLRQLVDGVRREVGLFRSLFALRSWSRLPRGLAKLSDLLDDDEEDEAEVELPFETSPASAEGLAQILAKAPWFEGECTVDVWLDLDADDGGEATIMVGELEIGRTAVPAGTARQLAALARGGKRIVADGSLDLEDDDGTCQVGELWVVLPR